MIGTVFTASREATAFANDYADGRIDAVEAGAPVHTDDLLVAVTEPGKINAALATERLLRAHDVSVLVHAGSCTALNDAMEVGTLVGVSSVLEGDRVDLEAPTYPQMPLSLPVDTPAEGVLVSQDRPLAPSEDESGYWERLADVRDETGYAVAYVAAQHGTPCHLAKVVVDRAGASSEPAPANQQEVEQTLTSFLRRCIDELSG